MKGRKQRYVFLAALICMTAGCAAATAPRVPDVQTTTLPPAKILEDMQRQTASSIGVSPLADIQPRAAVTEKLPFETRLFSLSLRDAGLYDAVFGLAKEAGLNLVFDRNVDSGVPVSVDLQNVSLNKALDIILSSTGYFYAIEGNVLRIKALETRIFRFDYPLVSNQPETDIGGDVLGSNSGSGSSGTNNDLSGEFSVESEVEEEDINVWNMIKDALRQGGSGENEGGLLSEQGRAQINPMSGTIVVTDQREHIDLVEEYLEELQHSLRRQVIIEAKIIEVNLNSGHQFGIDWNYINRTLSRYGEFEFSSSLSSGTGGLNIGWSRSSANTDFNVLMDAIATYGTANVLSSPRVNVINNQTALISVGRTIPWQQWELQGVSDNQGETITQIVPTIVQSQIGVTLGVTPQISRDGYVTLQIVPIITDFVEWRPFSVGENSFEVPILDVRESSTIVRALDSAVVIIGGLIQEKTRDSRSQVPLLGDIPGLGKLLSKQQRESSKIELVILITPTIVER